MASTSSMSGSRACTSAMRTEPIRGNWSPCREFLLRPDFLPMAAACVSPSGTPTSALLLCGRFPPTAKVCTRCCRTGTSHRRNLAEPGRPMESTSFLNRRATTLRTSGPGAKAHLFFAKPAEPTQLTVGPLLFSNPTPSVDGKKLFVIGQQRRFDLIGLDSKSQQFSVYLPGVSAGEADIRAMAGGSPTWRIPNSRCGEARWTEVPAPNSHMRPCRRTCLAGRRMGPRSRSWPRVQEDPGRFS